MGPGRAGNPDSQPSRYGAPDGIHRAPAVQDRGRQRLRSGHLRHEGRRLSRLPRVPAALRGHRALVARRDPALRLGRGNRQPDLARADRGRGAQGKICAGDRARPRRRKNRHRTQGRRALRDIRQRRPCARRHAARGRPQRDTRTRQHHPDAGGHERSEARRDRQCRRGQRRHQAERHRGGGLCRGRHARSHDRGCRRTRSQNPQSEIAQRRRQRQGRRAN